MTTVTSTAGHSGIVSWKTSTSAQLSAMKMAAKMYFSIGIPSAVQLLDPIGQTGDLAIEVDAQADEHRDRHGEHAERDPQEQVLLAGPHQRLVGRLARRRQHLGHLDMAFDLGAQAVDHAHEL